jgi:ABC-type phosphate/phosphonate transport system ATPase subunit
VLVSLHQVEYALRYCPRTIAFDPAKSSTMDQRVR